MSTAAASLFYERIVTGVNSSVDMTKLAKWLELNTTHPKISGEAWGFKDHEFQIALINEDAPHMVCRKCSQVGVSELTLRLVLGLISILPQHTAIYTLPTTGFASKFAKSRFDPVIAASKFLSEALDRNIDNVELKKIGTSFLYILGTFTQTGAISVPADILVHDEVDFSDQQAMTTFSSRLGHAEGGGIKREFSTPTVEGYGISKSFALSSQAQYAVRHESCGRIVLPNFMEDVILPGFDNELSEIEKEDLHNPSVDVASAWLKCPDCGSEITPQNLANPEAREWVHAYPDRKDLRGYQVFPYDVIKYNPLAKTLKSLKDYEKKSDWVNFKVGLPDEDASNSFLKQIMDNQTVVQHVSPREGAAMGCVAGIDIGKVSNILIGKPAGKKMEIIYAERIRQDSDGYLLKRVIELCKFFGVIKAVMDAGPDFTTSSAFVAKSWSGRYLANYYTRNKTTSSLSHIAINEEEGILNTVRSISFDLLVKKVNTGRIQFPKHSETVLVKQHLRAMKRIETFNNSGDRVVNWVNTGDDHYAHALNYLNIAATLLESNHRGTVVGCLPHAGKAKFKTGDVIEKVGL